MNLPVYPWRCGGTLHSPGHAELISTDLSFPWKVLLLSESFTLLPYLHKIMSCTKSYLIKQWKSHHCLRVTVKGRLVVIYEIKVVSFTNFLCVGSIKYFWFWFTASFFPPMWTYFILCWLQELLELIPFSIEQRESRDPSHQFSIRK